MKEWDKAIAQAEELVAEIQQDVSGVDARRYYAEKFLSLVEIKAEDQSLPTHSYCVGQEEYNIIHWYVNKMLKDGWMRVVKKGDPK